MIKLACKKCRGSRYVKSGTIRGHQRYLCQDCGCHFTATAARGKPPAMKALAALLYAMGNASHEMIAQLLGVSPVVVYKWIPKKVGKSPEPSAKVSTGLCPLMTCGVLSMEEGQDLGLENRRSCGKANPGLGVGWP